MSGTGSVKATGTCGNCDTSAAGSSASPSPAGAGAGESSRTGSATTCPSGARPGIPAGSASSTSSAGDAGTAGAEARGAWGSGLKASGFLQSPPPHRGPAPDAHQHGDDPDTD